ncbi:MAG: GTPase Era [Coriobacteriales bacterium]|jgi:GTP-binding protein Era|nr:GTPase Era [Coriobacteriales bacterium]
MCTDANFKSGFVCLLGRPNAGKSTLINAIVGEKLLIASNVAQTTRHRFRAILDADNYQMVLVDTPGIHKPKDLLGEQLNATANNAIKDVDIIAFVLAADAQFGRGDEWIISSLSAKNAPAIMLVLNKCDLVSATAIDEQLNAAESAFANAGIPIASTLVLSALTGKHVPSFVQAALPLLPTGPRWFPQGTSTDQPLEVIISEFIREKILFLTFAEVPHSIAVAVNEIEHEQKTNFYKIYATIFVERESQKGIILGKGGSNIKLIGTHARKDLEHFLGAHVFLDLRVKLRKGWRRDVTQIRRFGYGENIC